MSKRDYYEVLGCQKDASADDLKKAYRKLAMQFHPDRNPGDAEAEAKFKEVNEAYEILKDDQKRAAYDRFGHGAFDGSGGAGGFGGGAGFSGFGDIFEEMFGEFMGRRGGGGGGSNLRGSDLRYEMDISLEDAFAGRTATVTIQTSSGCEPCNGTGAKNGAAPATCPTCHGHGRVRAQQGFFTIERACPTCGGAGKVIKDPCSSCGGSGRQRKDKTLEVKIPAGVEDGTRIRLSGEGKPVCAGLPPGICIFSCRCVRTESSSATGPISTARCRSR